MLATAQLESQLHEWSAHDIKYGKWRYQCEQCHTPFMFQRDWIAHVSCLHRHRSEYLVKYFGNALVYEAVASFAAEVGHGNARHVGGLL